jgi:hypothetical protein
MTYRELIKNKVNGWQRIRSQEYKGSATDADNLLTTYKMEIYVFERAIKEIEKLEKTTCFPE